MRIGEYNDLRINRMVDFGAYLIDDDTHEVLLPKRYLTPEMNVGDTVRVFVYNDSENRPVATTEVPKAVVGEVSSASMRTVSPAIANTSLTPSDASTISWDRTPPAIATSPASAPILPPIPTTVSLSRIPRVRTRASSLVDRTLHDKMQLPTA